MTHEALGYKSYLCTFYHHTFKNITGNCFKKNIQVFVFYSIIVEPYYFCTI